MYQVVYLLYIILFCGQTKDIFHIIYNYPFCDQSWYICHKAEYKNLKDVL